jgi:putative resolvase
MSDTYKYRDSDLVQIGEAARIAGVSVSTLRRWDSDGVLVPVRTPGGRRRYRVAEVLATLQRPDRDTTPAAS